MALTKKERLQKKKQILNKQSDILALQLELSLDDIDIEQERPNKRKDELITQITLQLNAQNQAASYIQAEIDAEPIA